jgi:hypothetical protein
MDMTGSEGPEAQVVLHVHINMIELFVCNCGGGGRNDVIERLISFGGLWNLEIMHRILTGSS